MEEATPDKPDIKSGSFANTQSKAQNNKKNQKDFKHLKDLAPSGILDFKFFTKNEKQHKIDVEYEQVNRVLQMIENTKKQLQQQDLENIQKYDPNINSKINLQTLKNRIGIINPEYNQQELANMFPGKGEINSKELTEFLKNNEISDFDPMQEALEFFLDNNQNLNFHKLQTLMKEMGYGELDKKDIEILKECLDIDHDGKISSKDLKEIFSYINKKKYIDKKENNIMPSQQQQ